MKVIIASLALSLVATMAFAHEGHDHAPGMDQPTEITGTVEISQDSKKNLRLETVEAIVGVVEDATTVIGQIEALPSLSTAISSRISGRVSKVIALDGQQVKKGDPLIQIESRLVGDPPPQVTYSSPIDGVVLDRHASVGESIEPDRHLLKVADLREVYAVGKIFEGQIPSVRVGQSVRVRVEALGKEYLKGTVDRLGGLLDPETRTLGVWVKIANPSMQLRPNMRAQLSILTGSGDSVILVPREAVLGEMGQYFVFVQSEANPLEFERRGVVLGDRDDRNIEIVEGVLPGEKVVTTGNYQLQYIPTKPRE